MDYRQFVQRHRETGADVTLSVIPIDEERASDFGLMKIDNNGRVSAFSEKPKGDDLKAMQVDTTVLGLDVEAARKKPYIASMGIYVFKKEVLNTLLAQKFPDQTDFGKEIIPGAANLGFNIQAFLFDGYWEDIGTMKSFYDANLALTQQPHPPFSFYDEAAPIYTRSRYLPPSKLLDVQITESIIGEGCILKACRVHHSVLGIRTRIEAGTVIEDSLLMGSDYYQHYNERQIMTQNGEIPVGIGSNCIIRKAIVDKNARIGKNVKIVNKENVEESNQEDRGFYIRSGIVTILKGATIADGTVI